MPQTNTLIFKNGPKGAEPGLSIFKISFGAGDTYVTGGVTVDITPFVPPNSTIKDLLYSNPNSNGGHTGYFTPGTTPANGKLQLFNGTTEIANASSLAGVQVPTEIYFGRNINR
jgi:hypothetical protein